MNSRILGAAGAALAALAAMNGAAQAAVTYDGATVHSNALASATSLSDGDGNGSGSNDAAAPSFASTLSTGSYASGATVGSDFAVESQGQAFERAAATFASPSAGTITFSGMVSANVVSAGATAQGQDDGENYNYMFTVSTPSVFDLSYSFAETYSGVNNSYILIDTTDNSVSSQLQTHANTSGSVSVALDPGVYTLGASTEYGDFDYQGSPGSSTGTHTEAYSFSVSAAPEPAAWMLMIAGVGVVGAAFRFSRRRTAIAEAVAA